jgi:transcriptional regulator with XRE-family HTH domain
MDLIRFCEWCKLRKEELGWSIDKLAEVSGVGRATVAKIMSGKITGLNGETISAITCALVYGYNPNGEGWGKYPCAMMAMEYEQAQTVSEPCPECARHMEQHKSDREKIEFLKRQIEFKESQMVAKDKQLEDRAWFIRRRDRMIVILAMLLGVSVLLIITALFIDAFNPSVGFIWRESLSALAP